MLLPVILPWMMKLIEFTVWDETMICFMSHCCPIIAERPELWSDVHGPILVCWIKYFVGILIQLPSIPARVLGPLSPDPIIESQHSSSLDIELTE